MNRRTSSLTRRWFIPFALGLLVALLGLVQPRAASAADCIVSSTANDGPNSLRAVVANTGCDNISFAVPNPSTITLSSVIIINRNLTIAGPRGASLTLSGNNVTSIFRVDTGSVVSISDVTVANGNGSSGGGIYVSGNLSLTRSSVINSRAFNDGGGIGMGGGTLTLTDSTISGNSSGLYGGASRTGVASRT